MDPAIVWNDRIKLERIGRVELHSAQLGRLATHLVLTRKILVPLERIELPSSDYKTDVLPFNYRGKFGCGWQIRTADAPSLWDWSGDHPTRYTFIITYFIYVGNWWSLKESNHPPTTPQLKATDLQSAERNRLQKNTTGSAFALFPVKFFYCWKDPKTGTLYKNRTCVYRLSADCSAIELTRYNWRSVGVTISFFWRDKPTCVHEHLRTKICGITNFSRISNVDTDRTSGDAPKITRHTPIVWIDRKNTLSDLVPQRRLELLKFGF